MRTAIVLVCAAVFAGLVAFAFGGLPQFGDYRGPYGDVVKPISLHERKTTNLTSAVAYDIRGFDTIGEELVLCAAAAGVALTLRPRGARHREDEGTDRATPAGRPSRSSRPASRWMAGILTAFGFVYSFNMSAHASQTPGGGFQGGAFAASVVLSVYLAWDYRQWSKVISEPPFDVAEALGVAAFIAIGVVAIALGHRLLANWIPYGQDGEIGSGGILFPINLGIVVCVGAAFVAIAGSMLRELHEDPGGPLGS